MSGLLIQILTEFDPGSYLRLCRRTVRKGYAFPAEINKYSGEAMPRRMGGAASEVKKPPTERRSLSARYGGRAASFVPALLILLALASCQKVPSKLQSAVPTPTPVAQPLPANASPQLKLLIAAAVEQSKVTTGYDPSWVKIDYPNGDVPLETGVCSDVIVRAFRKTGIDLQKEVHEDMTRAWSAYPRKWGANGTDTSIDHRRVLNLTTFFERNGKSIPITENRADYLPGDIVAWELSNGVEHIGIMTDLWTEPEKHCLVVHNIGAGARIEDVLFAWKIIGHYRYFQ